MLPELHYTAPRSVIEAIGSLGRTEDLCFSPSNRRLAVAAFARDRIAVFDIDITSSANGIQVALTGGMELSSSAVQRPHGVAFLDNDRVIVTSRASDVAVFKLPPGETNIPLHEILPIVTWPSSATKVPGSVSVVRVSEGAYDILICNNAAHTITRHLLDGDAGGVTKNGEVLLRKHLDIPDGVTVSPDRRWIAVSNHNSHNVLLYETSPSLNPDAPPDGILRRVYYPHGLRFTQDGRHLIVADAGAPYLHVYARDPDGWHGVRHPLATLKVMADAVFRRGRHNRQEGGPKGIAIDADSTVLATTSEYQPLAFFDLPELLRHALSGRSACEQRALDVKYELNMMHLMRESRESARRAAAEADAVQSSRSWRMTAPLRRLNAALQQHTSVVSRPRSRQAPREAE